MSQSPVEEDRRPPRQSTDGRAGSGNGARSEGVTESSGSARAVTARRRSRLGLALIAAGLLVAAYAATVLLWRDPLTDLYARRTQHQLSASLVESFGDYRQNVSKSRSAAEAERSRGAAQQAVAELARQFEARMKLGQPIGKIVVPKLGVNAVFIHGTRWAEDLSRGPGHYPETSVPGRGKTIAVAGHRTTFGAPFRHIDKLRAGDVIRLALPYGTFEYRVFSYRIVEDDDWSIVRQRGFETVVLSACHPLYSAEQRWVVFGKLARVDPVVGSSYTLKRRA